MLNSAKIYQRSVKIHFHESDPAGIMYFAHIFTLAHTTFEEFLGHIGILWKEWFQENTYLVPIRHTSADFRIPFQAGENYQVEVSVTKISDSTFHMHYDFKSSLGLHATVNMSHTYVDKISKQKTTIPKAMRDRLLPYVRADI